MKLTIEFNGDNSSFELKQNLTIDIEHDARALGYITAVIFETALTLSKLMDAANPVYGPNLALGVAYCAVEKAKENNLNYPFTRMMVVDEGTNLTPPFGE